MWLGTLVPIEILYLPALIIGSSKQAFLSVSILSEVKRVITREGPFLLAPGTSFVKESSLLPTLLFSGQGEQEMLSSELDQAHKPFCSD